MKTKTYCDSNCTNKACERYVNIELFANTVKLPKIIWTADFSKDCPDYTPEKKVA